MAEPDKAAERTTLAMELEYLLSRLRDLSEGEIPARSLELQVRAAQFAEDMGDWSTRALAFATVNGVRFDGEYSEMLSGLGELRNALNGMRRDDRTAAERQAYLKREIDRARETTMHAINSVPIAWEPLLSAEKTLFSTHLRIFDAIKTAQTRLHYFDRYLDADFFPLYLRKLERGLEIRLVTTKSGVQDVLAVSKRAAQEFSNFALLECTPTDVHDRNLRIDGNIFFLGPSANAAGKAPTNFSVGDSTARAHSVLDDILSKATIVL